MCFLRRVLLLFVFCTIALSQYAYSQDLRENIESCQKCDYEACNILYQYTYQLCNFYGNYASCNDMIIINNIVALCQGAHDSNHIRRWNMQKGMSRQAPQISPYEKKILQQSEFIANSSMFRELTPQEIQILKEAEPIIEKYKGLNMTSQQSNTLKKIGESIFKVLKKIRIP